MPWYFYLALKQLFPTGRFPFFTTISVLGVSLGVGVLIIVTSVMGGFGYEIRRMIVETEGEITVKSEHTIDDAPQMLARIRTVPGVAAATPFARGIVQASAGENRAYPMFRGLDLATVGDVTNLARFISPAGALDQLDDDSVILSSQLALTLGVPLGGQVEIYSPLLLETAKNNEVPLPRQFRVVGQLYIGHQQLDSSVVYGTMRAAQEIYGLGDRVHGINVRVKPGTNEAVVAGEINAVLPGNARAYLWMQNWADFLWVLNLEKSINFFLLLFIVIIAAFSVMSSLLISVVRKTREIGLLGALGASAQQVALCFCAQAFIIGVTGTAIGLAVGFGVLAIRNDIVHGLADLFQRRETLQQFYQFADLPSHTLWASDVPMIVLAAILISTLAGLLPAWRAAKLKPVEALRSE